MQIYQEKESGLELSRMEETRQRIGKPIVIALPDETRLRQWPFLKSWNTRFLWLWSILA